MQRIAKWFLMLNKRLYKKVSFVLLLVAVPICVSILSYVSAQQSGFLKVVLAQIDPSDPISSALVDEISSAESLINFSVAQNYDEAKRSVEMGKADVAWVFDENMKDRLRDFVEGKESSKPAVRVIVRESNVFTRISQEKLCAEIFKYTTKIEFIRYIREKIDALDDVDDSTLEKYFDDTVISEDLFAVENLSGVSVAEEEVNYMTAPIRGLLGVLICLCSMAATMFYMQDEQRGTFAQVRENLRFFVALACVLIATANISLVVLITLYASNLAVGFMKEFLILILYAFCSSLFCLLLKQVFTRIRIYAAFIPLSVVAMIAVCPIFKGVPMLQYLLPPTYYVEAFYDNSAILFMIIYTSFLALLCLLLELANFKKFHNK